MDYTNYQLPAKTRGLKKSEFLQTEAAPAVKKAAFAALIIFVVIAVLVVVATITTNSASMLDLPLIKLVTEDRDREAMKKELSQSADLLDEAEDLLEDIEDEYGSKVFRAAKNMIKKTEAAARKMSINNTIGMMKSIEKLGKIAEDAVIEQLDVDDLIDSFEEISKILTTIRTVTYVFAVIVILLALLAAFKKLTWLSILCIFLYVPACALLSSVLLAVLVTIALIALAVATSRVNKAWKSAVPCAAE